MSSEGSTVPDGVLHRALNILQPRDKTQMQHLIGMYGSWRSHIPYLRIIMKSLQRVIRKAANFQWGQGQREVFWDSL